MQVFLVILTALAVLVGALLIGFLVIDIFLRKREKPKTVQDRVTEERDTLAGNLEKLTAFIENESQFSKVSSTQQDLLKRQRLAMEAYKAILDARLENFATTKEAQ